jgi:hypothetical protein
MWGKTRPSGVYYQCQVTHQRSANMPADHPATVHLSEAKLNRAVLDFLATAIFGPEREEYWRHCLTMANEDQTNWPVENRRLELEKEVVDLEARLERQVLSLEAEDATPALRKRVAQRIAELDEALADRSHRLDQLAPQAPPEAPQFGDVAELLSKLPLIASRLRELPTAELRQLFEGLQLQVTYHHEKKEADVEIVPHKGLVPRDGAQVCPVPPVRAGIDLSSLVRFRALHQALGGVALSWNFRIRRDF